MPAGAEVKPGELATELDCTYEMMLHEVFPYLVNEGVLVHSLRTYRKA